MKKALSLTMMLLLIALSGCTSDANRKLIDDEHFKHTNITGIMIGDEVWDCYYIEYIEGYIDTHFYQCYKGDMIMSLSDGEYAQANHVIEELGGE